MAVLDRAFAAIYDPFMAGAEAGRLGGLREEVLAGLDGHVVEIGAGTGANLPHYPASVRRLSLCEPEPAMRERLRAKVERLADDRIEVLEAPAESLPFDDASIDHVVATLVLCTVDDLVAAVVEARRVLRPGGTLTVIEHVASDGTVARAVQRAATPAWRVVARGCHLDRPTVDVLEAAGFDTSRLEQADVPGMDRMGPVVAGPAIAPEDGDDDGEPASDGIDAAGEAEGPSD